MGETLAACMAQLRAIAQGRAQGQSTAAKVDSAGQALCTQAMATIREVLYEWNGAKSRWRMPPEVLAACCRYLSFRERIAVSHVSRSWRSAVVQFPELWSDIWLTDLMKRPQDLLRVVLDRTGQRPLDIWYTRPGYEPDVTASFAPSSDRRMGLPIGDVLAPHMYHVRTLVWCDNLDAPCFLLPAPLLTELRCTTVASTPEGFLGSICASLETLSVDGICLPASCPSLSTVVTLLAELPPERRDTAHLPRLFEICPSLEHLTIRGEIRFYADVLPAGPAPRTLRQLELVDYDDSASTIEVFVRWRTDALKDVRLVLSGLPLGGDSSALFEGTVAMAIAHRRSETGVEIATTTASGSKLVLDVSWFEDEVEGDALSLIAQFIRHGQDSLRKLRSLTLPLHVLLRVMAALIPLPALAELYVWIECPEPGGLPALLAEKDAFVVLLLQSALELVTVDFVNPPASPDGLKEFLSAISKFYHSIHADVKRPRMVLRGLSDAHLDACGLLDTDPVAGVFSRADAG